VAAAARERMMLSFIGPLFEIVAWGELYDGRGTAQVPGARRHVGQPENRGRHTPGAKAPLSGGREEGQA
jgi:hypothetical protein